MKALLGYLLQRLRRMLGQDRGGLYAITASKNKRRFSRYRALDKTLPEWERFQRATGPPYLQKPSDAAHGAFAPEAWWAAKDLEMRSQRFTEALEHASRVMAREARLIRVLVARMPRDRRD
jgi:hypothetical protein